MSITELSLTSSAIVGRARNTVRCVTRVMASASLVSLIAVLVVSGGSASAAPTLPRLGLAARYAILAESGVTTTGVSHVTGIVASLAPVSASDAGSSGLVGGLAGTLNDLLGSTSIGVTSGSLGVRNAEFLAYQSAESLAPTHVFGGASLAGVTLSPGVYAWPGSLSLGAGVTLNARGDRDGDFIFQIPGTFSTLAHAALTLTNGAQASHVLWQVGGDAIVAASTSLAGTILAEDDITLESGTRLLGRALSLGGLVNLDASTVTLPPAAGVVRSAVGTVASSAASAVPSSGAGITASTPSSTPATGAGVTGPLALPVIPLASIAVPDLAVPEGEVAHVSSLPSALGVIPLESLTSPVTLPTSSSTAASPSSSTLTPSLSLGEVNVPSLSLPSTSSVVPSTTPLVSNLELPSVSLAPNLATSPASTSPSGRGTLTHVRAKPSASRGGVPSSHAKTGSSSTPSGTIIPLGAPQTGLGAALGSLGTLRLVIAGAAMALAAGFALLGLRRRHARGWR